VFSLEMELYSLDPVYVTVNCNLSNALVKKKTVNVNLSNGPVTILFRFSEFKTSRLLSERKH
jgi:hypothetical protein